MSQIVRGEDYKDFGRERTGWESEPSQQNYFKIYKGRELSRSDMTSCRVTFWK